MKNITIVAALLLLTMTHVRAQDKHYGIRMGYQSSTMMLDTEKQGGSLNGYYISAYRDAKVLPFLHFNTGIEYMRMGSEVSKQDYKLDYLGVPLALKLKVGPLYALGGGMINFKISEKGNPYNSSAKWYDTNAFVGGGLNILIFSVEAKYMWGLTKVNNGLKNNGLQIGCGIRF